MVHINKYKIIIIMRSMIQQSKDYKNNKMNMNNDIKINNLYKTFVIIKA